MDQRIIVAIDMLNTLFQGWLAQWFFKKYMNPKFRFASVVLFSAWVAVKLSFELMGQKNYDVMTPIVRRAAFFLTLFFFAVMLYQAGTAIKLYLSVTFMAIMEISFFLAYMIIAFGGYVLDYWTWRFEMGYFSSAGQFLCLINITATAMQTMMYAVFAILFFIMLRSIVSAYRQKKYALQKNELMFILTPSLIALLFCMLLRMVIMTVEDNMPVLLYQKYPLLLILVPLVLILSLLSIMYGIALLHDLINLNQERSGRLILERQVCGMQEHFQEMERVYSGIRGVKHDLNNQLAVLLQYAKQQNTDALYLHLAEMNRAIDALDYRYKTGNSAADAILNLKYHEAVLRMPDIQINADQLFFPERMAIQSYDVAIVLSNALDNAIEACLTMSVEKEKFILIKSYQKGKLFFLEVQNSFNGQLVCVGQQEFPKSQKKDQMFHGMGLFNIKTAALKYEGAMDWEAQNNIFTLTVMMKNEIGLLSDGETAK